MLLVRTWLSFIVRVTNVFYRVTGWQSLPTGEIKSVDSQSGDYSFIIQHGTEPVTLRSHLNIQPATSVWSNDKKLVERYIYITLILYHILFHY